MLPTPAKLLGVLCVVLQVAGCTTSPGDASPPPPVATASERRPSGGAPGPGATSSPTASEPSAPPLPGCEHPDGERTWGLHCTDEELATWRERFDHGPYAVAGDVVPNSPGDAVRIRLAAAEFSGAPTLGWTGPGGEGCVGRGDDAPEIEPANRVRDAAFTALLTDDADLRRAVAAALLEAARQPGLDFADRERWCAGRLYDLNPGFEIANWLTRLLYALDYVGPAPFTAAELRELDAWHAAAAELFAEDLRRSRAAIFRDPEAEAPTPREPAGDCARTTWVGGPRVCDISLAFNNRKAALARHVTLVGVRLGRDDLVEVGTDFVTDLLRYGVLGEGTMAEFERWTEELPDLGWAYATQTIGPAVTIADALERQGRGELFRLEVTDGVTSEPRSIASTVADLLRYTDGTYDRYAGDDPAREGDPRWRIDGRDDASGWESIHALVVVPSSPHLDAGARAALRRSSYPTDPAGEGPVSPWQGEHGTLPAVLLMFGEAP